MSAILVTFPNAPKVSEKAIKENEKLQIKAKEEIEAKIYEYVKVAQDSLDVDEPYVMQQLINSLPPEYEVPAKRPWISETLQELRKKKFDDQDLPVDSQFDSPPNPLYTGEDTGATLTELPAEDTR